MLIIDGALAVFNGIFVQSAKFWCECVRGGVCCNGECHCGEGECCGDEWRTEDGYCCGDALWSPDNDPNAPCGEGETFLRWGDAADQCCACVPGEFMDPALNGGIEGAENVAAALCCPICEQVVFRDEFGECPVRCCENGSCENKKPSDCAGISLGNGCCDLGCPAPCCDPDGGFCEVTDQQACLAPNIIGAGSACDETACVGACCVYDESGNYVLHESSPTSKANCDAIGGEFQGVGKTQCIGCTEAGFPQQVSCREPFSACCCEEKTSNGAGLTFYQPGTKRKPPFEGTVWATVEVTSIGPIRVHGELYIPSPYDRCVRETIMFPLCWDAFNVEPVPCGSNFKDLKIKVCWSQVDTELETLKFSGCNDITIWLGNCLHECATHMTYDGPGHTSNANIETRGGGTIFADGTGPIVLTSNVVQRGSQCERTLTLAGSNDQANEIRTITGIATSVVKDGVGRWRFNAPSKGFAGTLKVKNGTLQVASAGAVGSTVGMGEGNWASFVLEENRTANPSFDIKPASGRVLIGGMHSSGKSTYSSGEIRMSGPVTLAAKTGGTVQFNSTWAGEVTLSPCDQDVTVGAPDFAGTVLLYHSGVLETSGDVTIAHGTAVMGYDTQIDAGSLLVKTGATLQIRSAYADNIAPTTEVTAETATIILQGEAGDPPPVQPLDSLVVTGALTLQGDGSLTVESLSGGGSIVHGGGTLTIEKNSMTGSMSIAGGSVIVNEFISNPGDIGVSATFTSSTLTVEFSGDPEPESEYVLLAGPTVQSYTPTLTGTQVKGRYVSGTSTLVISSAPTDIALSNSSVVENAPIGTLVGALSTTDADSWDTFTYTIVSGSGFSIDGNLLRTSQSFNYESQSSATVRIRSTDSSGFYTEKDFTIQITNANDAPTDISLSSAAAVRGAAIGTLVGTLTTTDEDVGDTFSYSLVYGFGENYLFSISGNQVLTAAVFDGSTPSSCLIRIISTDSGGKTVQKNFTITVT